jgi:hypothetical protein
MAAMVLSSMARASAAEPDSAAARLSVLKPDKDAATQARAIHFFMVISLFEIGYGRIDSIAGMNRSRA